MAAEPGQHAGRGAEATPQPAARPSRMLLLVEVSGADPGLLAERMGLTLYEARQWLVRGGVRFHRALEPAAAEAEARRLQGLRVVVVPEAELLPALQPACARGGSFARGVLELHGRDGALRVRQADVLGLVRGPIAREYAAQDAGRRRTPGSAGLEAGYRFQLHRFVGPPVELDPWAFEFRERELGRSSLLALTDWVLAVARDRPQDDGFRRLPPALAPSEEPSDEARSALGHGERPRGAPVVLDNLRQFRFYSGWRAALLRRGV